MRSELLYALVRLDKEYLETKPDDAWETFYAKELLATFGTGGAAGKLLADV